jgi:hypothetical protein
MELEFPNKRYEELTDEDLFMEIIHMVCEMRARYDLTEEWAKIGQRLRDTEGTVQ